MSATFGTEVSYNFFPQHHYLQLRYTSSDQSELFLIYQHLIHHTEILSNLNYLEWTLDCQLLNI